MWFVSMIQLERGLIIMAPCRLLNLPSHLNGLLLNVYCKSMTIILGGTILLLFIEVDTSGDIQLLVFVECQRTHRP